MLGPNVQAKTSVGELFTYSDIKYKAGYSDEATDGKTGLLLYGYDSAATASFNGSFSGVFTAALDAIPYDGSLDLRRWSLVFTDAESGEKFSVGVMDGGEVSDVYVVYGGDRAGIYYGAEGNSSPNGYTAGYNDIMAQYTRFGGGDAAELRFDRTR